ncbi:ribosome biogenesis GTP-binding protein YsxC [Acetobacter estunensis NRIC 0472]|uniref:Probable GTP-binding protein EngB n=1 Tax=Acetobacter estunensis TaxID=104097 RepID=A0A967EIB8_9PROT|nr:ribosome biogenesis GTP-binding protein YihA/YsxC [Acetobacter estunensis]NHO52944.1 YihA family ribosome biogenesis GTP-binding protein [Acetobacter estunensis]GBQ23429.1 ribosome biogenesis GTP-binding protein YsxC [Acetobacter estunensis NRIC 0472]
MGEADGRDFSASLTLSPEQIEAGRLLFARPCEFFHGAQNISQLPVSDAPEVAFAGRSNVGKSSLINALTGQKSLARASSEPGRTKQLNFFDLGGRLVLVDMPGYGYAKAAKSVKEDWQGMMFDYLRGRPNLRRVVLLLDARVETKASDREVMDLFDKAAINFQVVLTKCDDVKPKAEEARYREVAAEMSRHPAAHPVVLPTSSQTGRGIPELRAELAAFAEEPAN